MKAKALFDCTADDIGELSFSEGDVLVDVVNSVEDGWYEGRVEGSNIRGLFPFNYVEILEDPVISPMLIKTNKERPRQEPHDNLSSSQPSVAPSSSWSILTKDEENEARKATLTDSRQIPISKPNEVKSTSSIASSSAFSSPKPKPKPMPALNAFARNQKVDTTRAPSMPIIKPKPAVAAKPTNLERNSETIPTAKAPGYLVRPEIEKTMTNSNFRSRSMSNPTNKSPARFGNATQEKTSTIPSEGSRFGNDKFSHNEAQEPFGVVLRKTSTPHMPPKPNPLRTTEPKPANTASSQAKEKPLFTEMRNDDNSEDEEGYQLVKPSSLRQRNRAKTTGADTQKSFNAASRPPFGAPISSIQKRQMGPEPSLIKPTTANLRPVNSPKPATQSEPIVNSLDAMSAGNNPAPRLPSRPSASRRPRKNASSKSSTVDVKTRGKALSEPKPASAFTASPAIKHKPVGITRNTTDMPDNSVIKPLRKAESVEEERKPPSVSNLTRQFNSNKPLSGVAYTPVALKPKSNSISYPQMPGKPTSLSGSSSSSITLPPRLLPNASSESTTGSSTGGSNAPPPVLRPKPVQYQVNSTGTLNSSIDSSPKGKDQTVTKQPAITRATSSNTSLLARKKAAAPPPPATASIPENARLRYERLFETINDREKVDGATTKQVWKKSKLSDKVLADVWKHCDKDSTGLLDKSSFIQGMGEIDERLRREKLKRQAQK
ncbi:hypothetical protein INT43_003935 [Umbelopsis isabellina]|uniref:SH3 domain-containing protein n=1 Tax=Mortierella isabellina TaxID=91625 RepID=A0A8H7PTP2_MORIS|nr:hypothetical protein INT43_003935 [Umbelopsis isabellina]